MKIFSLINCIINIDSTIFALEIYTIFNQKMTKTKVEEVVKEMTILKQQHLKQMQDLQVWEINLKLLHNYFIN
jgi:hypothetical protein